MPSYPVTPYVWTLDGVSFGDGAVARYLTRVRGWAGRTPPKMNKTAKIGAHGDWLGGHYLGGRTIEVDGCWRPSSRVDAEAACDTIAGLCSSGDALTQYILRRTTATRDRWTRIVLDDKLEPVIERSGLITFTTQLYSADPRWFSSAMQTWGPTGLPTEADGGVLWNGGTGTSGDGIQWNGGTGTSGDGVVYQGAPGSSGTVVVTNDGDEYAGLVIIMTATGGAGLYQPFVVMSETGETIQYSSLLSPGGSIEINTDTAGVRLNGAYVNSGVLLRAQMMKIPPRSTRTLTFGSVNSGDQGLMSGYHYHTYQGG
jgi:hypothetical protein